MDRALRYIADITLHRAPWLKRGRGPGLSGVNRPWFGRRRALNGGQMGRRRVKRQEVKGEDGWTVVTHGILGLSLFGAAKEKEEQKGTRKVAGGRPTDTVDGLTAEKLSSDFKRMQDAWKDSKVNEQIENVLKTREWSIDKAVCIGIGSFSLDWEPRYRSLWQLALLLDVVTRLNKEGHKIEIIAQEPAFTPLDIEFLSSLGIKTVTDNIESHITPQTLVYSPFVPWNFLLPTILRGKDPVLYLGNLILDDYSPTGGMSSDKPKIDECSEIGRVFLEKRKVVELGPFEHHPYAFNGFFAYWKSVSE